MGQAENSTTKACIDYLRLNGAYVWRNNSRTVMVPGKGGTLRPMFFGFPGSPDIIGLLPGGRWIGVEVKPPLGPKGGVKGGKQSPDQVAFQREVEQRGGLYVLARNLDDLIAALGATQ